MGTAKYSVGIEAALMKYIEDKDAPISERKQTLINTLDELTDQYIDNIYPYVILARLIFRIRCNNTKLEEESALADCALYFIGKAQQRIVELYDDADRGFRGGLKRSWIKAHEQDIQEATEAFEYLREFAKYTPGVSEIPPKAKEDYIESQCAQRFFAKISTTNAPSPAPRSS